MPDRLGWICPRCLASLSPDTPACVPCPGRFRKPQPDTGGGPIFAPMRAGLPSSPELILALQAALTMAADGMLSEEIIVLPPGSRVLPPGKPLTVPLPLYMAAEHAVQHARVTTVWAEVFPSLEASLRSVRTGVAEVDFRLTPQEGRQSDG